ncbi:MAG: hypothetical protein ACYC21_15795 [Eubacteriales bacterium]
MWSNRPSLFLLVRISFGGSRSLVIPIPLFVVDITLDAMADLTLVADLFAPLWRRGLKYSRFRISSLAALLGVCTEFFNELRKYGRWRMVEVAADKVRVYVDFY